jgi:hypothetical protein
VADATGFALTGVDGFDFAAIFFVFATALAMICNNPREEMGFAPYTTLGRGAQAAKPVSILQMQPFQQPKADQAVEKQKDRDHQTEQPRHDQNEQACNDRHDR